MGNVEELARQADLPLELGGAQGTGFHLLCLLAMRTLREVAAKGGGKLGDATRAPLGLEFAPAAHFALVQVQHQSEFLLRRTDQWSLGVRTDPVSQCRQRHAADHRATGQPGLPDHSLSFMVARV